MRYEPYYGIAIEPPVPDRPRAPKPAPVPVTAHKLARHLMAGPDLPVMLIDECSCSYPLELEHVTLDRADDTPFGTPPSQVTLW